MRYYKLQDWYVTFTPVQQEIIKKHFSIMGKDPRMLDTGIWQSDATASDFLWPIGLNAVSGKDYDVAEAVLTKSFELNDNIISKHFSLIGLIELTYKLRNENVRVLEQCKEYCLLDITIAREFIQAERVRFFSDCYFTRAEHTLEETARFLEAHDRGVSKKDFIIQSGYPYEDKL
jgi:hypothetical protein